jgi:multidrug efflux system membrane fusion protein
MTNKLIIFWVVGGLLGALSACSPKPEIQEPVRAVKILEVGATDLNTDADFAGELRARTETRLGFRVPGKLTDRPAQPGQRVRAGQVLAQLDPLDLQLAVQGAQAAMASAQNQRDLALAELRRFEALRAQNFISSAELERREATLKAAEAALTQARAQLAAQTNQADYTRLVSTSAGVVTAVEAEIGQVLAAGQTVVRLAHDGPRDAVFSVPEQRVAAFRPGQSLKATVASTGQTYSGQVREIAASADPLTRTFQVKMALPGSQDLPLGVTVNIQSPSQSASVKALKLPTTALMQQGQGTAVWVLDDASMTVHAQSIQVLAVDGQEVVVASGLRAGQKVVVAGVHTLAPGQKVTVFNPPVKASR